MSPFAGLFFLTDVHSLFCDLMCSANQSLPLNGVLFIVYISLAINFNSLSSRISLFPVPLPLCRHFSALLHWLPCCFSFSTFKISHISLINLLHSFIPSWIFISLPSIFTFSLRFSFLFSPSHRVYFRYTAVPLIFPIKNTKKHPNSHEEILGKGHFHCALRSRIYSEISFRLPHICIIISK